MGRAGIEQFQQEQQESTGQAASSPTRTLLRFHPDVRQLLISGGIEFGDELAGAPALVQTQLGDGHVVMFAFNPMWRSGTLGSYALVFNAFLHHGHLDTVHSVDEDNGD